MACEIPEAAPALGAPALKFDCFGVAIAFEIPDSVLKLGVLRDPLLTSAPELAFECASRFFFSISLNAEVGLASSSLVTEVTEAPGEGPESKDLILTVGSSSSSSEAEAGRRDWPAKAFCCMPKVDGVATLASTS